MLRALLIGFLQYCRQLYKSYGGSLLQAVHSCLSHQLLSSDIDCTPYFSKAAGVLWSGRDQVVGTVLEPTSIGVKMEMVGSSGTFILDISNIRINLSPDILQLALGLQSTVLEPLVQPSAHQPVTRCSRFVKVSIISHNINPDLGCTAFRLSKTEKDLSAVTANIEEMLSLL